MNLKWLGEGSSHLGASHSQVCILLLTFTTVQFFCEKYGLFQASIDELDECSSPVTSTLYILHCTTQDKPQTHVLSATSTVNSFFSTDLE